MGDKFDQAAYMADYYKKKTMTKLLRLNLQSDADIIKRIENVENVNGYIKRLIREDIKGGNEMITNLHNDGKTWTWRNRNDSRGVYYTNENGEGVFFQSDRTGNTKQLVGTCQFTACSSASGMRRKLNHLFDEWGGDLYEDPNI